MLKAQILREDIVTCIQVWLLSFLLHQWSVSSSQKLILVLKKVETLSKEEWMLFNLGPLQRGSKAGVSRSLKKELEPWSTHKPMLWPVPGTVCTISCWQEIARFTQFYPHLTERHWLCHLLYPQFQEASVIWLQILRKHHGHILCYVFMSCDPLRLCNWWKERCWR